MPGGGQPEPPVGDQPNSFIFGLFPAQPAMPPGTPGLTQPRTPARLDLGPAPAGPAVPGLDLCPLPDWYPISFGPGPDLEYADPFSGGVIEGFPAWPGEAKRPGNAVFAKPADLPGQGKPGNYAGFLDRPSPQRNAPYYGVFYGWAASRPPVMVDGITPARASLEMGAPGLRVLIDLFRGHP